MESLSPDVIALLTLTAFIAGFIDSIAGGGGLLTIPAFLLAGVSPAQALATNKLQSVFGSGSAAFTFARARMIDWRAARTGFFCALAGAGLGALAVQQIDPEFLRTIIPYVLIALALYFALSPNLSDEPRHHYINAKQHGLFAGSAIGFYDGIFGPGTGSFLAVSYITLLGYGLKRATAHSKLLNLASNSGALVVFIFGGKTLILLGLLMGIGQVCGANLGSRTALNHGARIIRPLLVVVCCAMAVKLLLT